MGSNLVRPRRSMTNAMAAWRVTGTSHRTNNIKWANLMGRTGRLLANRSAHKGQSDGSYRHRRKGYFPRQLLGEHIGGGDPPSARDEVDIAPNNSRVSSSR